MPSADGHLGLTIPEPSPLVAALAPAVAAMRSVHHLTVPTDEAIVGTVLDALAEAGYEVVKVITEVTPQTVYIGTAHDEYRTCWRQGDTKRRVLVVEA